MDLTKLGKQLPRLVTQVPQQRSCAVGHSHSLKPPCELSDDRNCLYGGYGMITRSRVVSAATLLRLRYQQRCCTEVYCRHGLLVELHPLE